MSLVRTTLLDGPEKLEPGFYGRVTVVGIELLKALGLPLLGELASLVSVTSPADRDARTKDWLSGVSPESEHLIKLCAL